MIMIISRNEELALTAREIFFGMGYISDVASPDDAALAISGMHHAMLVFGRESIGEWRIFLRMVRAVAGDIPVFAVREDVSPEIYELFDGVCPRSIYSAQVLEDIIAISRERGLTPIGSYRLAGLDASVGSGEATFFGTPLGLTKTETMILRAIICRRPHGGTTEDILEHAFRTGRTPTEAGVRTHVSSINRKLTAVTGEPLISSSSGRYVLTLPEPSETEETSRSLAALV